MAASVVISAALSCRREILAFANKFGLLGIPESIAMHGVLTAAESMSTWIGEIRLLARAEVLRSSIAAHDRSALSQVIVWKDGRVGYEHSFRGKKGYTWIATKDINPELLERFDPGDVVAPAQHYLQRCVNERLLKHVSARLLWNIEHNRMNLWFEVQSPDGARSDKRFCGSACRARAWRKAQAPKGVSR